MRAEGLVLLIMVGGSAIAASFLVWRRHPLGGRAAVIAAAMIAGFAALQV